MKLKSIIQSILAATLLSTSFYAVAGDEVMCPAAGFIQKSSEALNTVSIMGSHKYTVWSLDAVRDNGISWHITTYATADDMNTALVIGQGNVKNITDLKNPVPMDMGEILLCSYKSSSDPEGVALISFKNENEKFKIAAFDLKALNLAKH